MTQDTTPDNPGRAVWYDLLTTDLATAKAFYTKLFGWTVNPVEMGMDAPYQMIQAGDKGIGGFIEIEHGTPTPSHWLSYVTVDDVDAAVQRAVDQGGVAATPAVDMPSVGRFAVVRDPTGASFSPFCSANPPQAVTQPGPGEFCWNELMTSDPEGSRAFYESVVGWKSQDMDMGPELGNYIMLAQADGTTNAGIMALPAEAEAPPHWLSYIMVLDVDTSAAQAVALGATQVVAPQDIPTIGRFSVLLDPTGAPFAVFANADAPPEA